MGRRPRNKPLNLTKHERQILDVYKEANDWLHGYAARERLTTRIAQPTFYAVLERLHNRGMLDREWEPWDHAQRRKTPRRRLLKINDHGRLALAETSQ